MCAAPTAMIHRPSEAAELPHVREQQTAVGKGRVVREGPEPWALLLGHGWGWLTGAEGGGWIYVSG